MKRIFTIVALFSALAVVAQTPDSVDIGTSYPNRAYYSFENGLQATIPNNNFDLAIATYPMMSSVIRINGRFGVQLFEYTAGDTSAWATLDTAGIGSGTGWIRNYDSDTTWEAGAFDANATGHPDYGWGTYNSVTHVVTGNTLFALKTRSNQWKKVWIEELGTDMIYDVRLADLDGNNDTVIQISRAGLTSKNFVFYDLDNYSVVDTDIDKTTYELLFLAYEGEISPGTWYNITGVLSNVGIQVAQVSNTHPDDADYSGATYVNRINEIGYDWKAFSGSWVLEDSLSYFVRTLDGDVWQIWFTGFQSTNGRFIFNKRQVGFVSIEENGTKTAAFKVFPNPASEVLNLVYAMNENGNASFRIFDLSGKTVYASTLEGEKGFNNHVVNLQQLNLATGTYIAHIEMNGKTVSEKIIIH